MTHAEQMATVAVLPLVKIVCPSVALEVNHAVSVGNAAAESPVVSLVDVFRAKSPPVAAVP